MPAARVSVVVPCFNGARYLAEAVRSVLDQDDEAVEVLVVDDGSTDGTPELLVQFAQQDRRLRFVSIENSGVSVARNTGYRLVSPASSYVLFLDADDVLAPGALRLLVDRLEADPACLAAFGTCSRVDSDGVQLAPAPARPVVEHVGERRVRRREAGAVVGYWDVAAITPISTPGQCLIRHAALGGDPPFDPAVSPCEDWDLWVRLARRGPIAVVPCEVLRYRDHPASASKSYKLMQEKRREVLRKQLDVVEPAEWSRFQRAWRHSLFGFDAQLCRRWARERLRQRDVLDALRLTLRSMRYTSRLLWAKATGQPRRPAAAERDFQTVLGDRGRSTRRRHVDQR